MIRAARAAWPLPVQQVVAAFEGDEVPRMPGGLENGAGIFDSHGVVRGGVQDHQRLVQLLDAVCQVGVFQVLHKMLADLHPLPAQVHLGAAFTQDLVQGGVEDMCHVLG
jgi:hypothetical protein